VVSLNYLGIASEPEIRQAFPRPKVGCSTIKLTCSTQFVTISPLINKGMYTTSPEEDTPQEIAFTVEDGFLKFTLPEVYVLSLENVEYK